MSKLRTVSGKEIEVSWISIHAYGNPLAFEAHLSSVMEAAEFCKDPEDLQILTYIEDLKETVYEGYVRPTFLQQTNIDRVVVYLSKEI